MIYTPSLSEEQLKTKFSKLRKLNYNPYRWWRMYESPKKPLHPRSSLQDKILNGDFDYSHYKYQAEWCEHEMNKVYQECHPDITKYVEKSSLLRSRRKRLLDDFNRDESDKLNSIVTEFSKTFKCSKEQIEEEMLEFSGSLIDFFYFIKEKYGTYWKPLKKI